MKTILPILFVATSLSIHAAADEGLSNTKPNVLFLSIDDLNDWVTSMGGNAQAKTPNMDQLFRQVATSGKATRWIDSSVAQASSLRFLRDRVMASRMLTPLLSWNRPLVLQCRIETTDDTDKHGFMQLSSMFLSIC